MNDPPQQSLSSTPPVSNQNFAMMPSQMSSLNTVDRIQGLQNFSSVGLPNLSFHIPYGNLPNTFIYPDNQFSPSRVPFVKDEKDDVSSSVLHSRPLSAPGSGSSPKSFGNFSPGSDQEKNDKLGAFADLVLGLDKGMSPLSILTSNIHDAGNTSPADTGTSQVSLRYQSRDAMLSAINYPDSVVLQEGAFDVNVNTLSALEEGLIGNLGHTGTSTNSTFDLFDGDGGQDAYMETNQDLQLSPHTFSTNADTFNESSNLSSMNGAANDVGNEDKMLDVNKLLVDKSRTKPRPTKATSPNRQGAQTCFQCGKVFSNSSALAKHKLTHSDERKYVCILCSKAFKRQDHLNGHMLTHRKKKPYECKVENCGKSYCDARSLRRHIENHHGTSSSVPVSTAGVISQLGLNLNPAALAGSGIFTETTKADDTFMANVTVPNRIQYAPPPVTNYLAVSSSGSLQTSVTIPTTSDIPSTSSGQLQLLEFQQQQTNTLSTWAQQQQQTQQSAQLQQRPLQQQTQQAQQSSQSQQSAHLYMPSQVFADPASNSPITGNDGYLTAQSCSTPTMDLDINVQHTESNILQSNCPSDLNLNIKTESVTLHDQASSLQQNNPLLCSELIAPLNRRMAASSLGIDQSNQSQANWANELTFAHSPVTNPTPTPDPKPVECPLCHRKFKNVPALNGHMRLHGGYFKKDSDSKKSEKKNDGGSHHPPLQTASMNVRALIEEKIIQRRIVNPQIMTIPTTTYSTVDIKPSEYSILPAPKNNEPEFISLPELESLPLDDPDNLDCIKQELLTQQTLSEKFRRHSDSDHFLTPRRPMANSALVDLLRRRVVGKRTQRTGSDPGESGVSPVSMSSPNESMISSPPQQSPLRSPVLVSSTATSVPSSPTTPTTPTSQWPSHKAQDFFFSKGSMKTFNIPTVITSSHTATLPMSVTATATTTTTALPVPKLHLERDDDDDVFLNPSSIPTSPIRTKKKHRPEPLFIPPHVNTNINRFPSQLRSPRLWDPTSEGKMGSPPPYTPPPMLSPVRNGSGLFWHIMSSGSMTPKSAPVTPRFSASYKTSVSDALPLDEEIASEPPETDIHPHVNVGVSFQAVLPHCRARLSSDYMKRKVDDLVWNPTSEANLMDEEVETYLDFACSAVIPGGGRNKEYALLLLHVVNGDIQEALLKLMNPVPSLISSHHLLTYKFPECDSWNPEEIEAYHQALIKCDKDFFAVAQEIQTKNVKQCIEFYYLWKKVCPDEYKRLRIIRKRKEQENLMHNLRSKVAIDLEEHEDKDRNSNQDKFLCEFPDCSATFYTRQALNGHVRVHSGGNLDKAYTVSNQGKADVKSYSAVEYDAASIVTEPVEPVKDFPCKVCGKVFAKVKSRSAHMKSHKESEKLVLSRYQTACIQKYRLRYR